MNDTAQIIVAYATLITASAAAVASLVNSFRITKVSNNVQIIEKATNSMKDALVEASAKASLAEGTAAGIVEGHAAGLEQGRQEIRPHNKEG